MILVTGASGFIGQHLIKKLIAEKGADQILALTSKPIADVKYLLHNNYFFTADFFKSPEYSTIDVLIHAGSFTPKSGVESNNIEGSQSNIENTFRLLKALPNTVRHIVFLSTLDIYSSTDLEIDENSKVAPSTLYGQSKLYCEKLIENWGLEHSIKVSILRIGHVYGPGEDAYIKIIPNTIDRLKRKIPPQIVGTGQALRSFIYIDDVVRCIVKAIDLKGNEGPLNIVSEYAISIKQLVQSLIDISGQPIEIEYLPQSGTEKNVVFNNSKMKQWLYSEATPLKQGLIAEWNYAKNL